MTLLPDFIGDIAASASGLPFGKAVSSLVEGVWRKRQERAKEVFLDEMRRGNLPPSYVQVDDETIAILLRFNRAAMEGAAKRNLRLMARVFVGMARVHSIQADEFLSLADSLSSLRREEAVVLADLLCAFKAIEDGLIENNQKNVNAFQEAKEKSMARLSINEEGYLSFCGSLLRTGFVLSISGFDGGVYIASPMGKRLAKLVEIEAIDLDA
ncbi:hypothetical protein [Inquilinus sp. OTU3971]|uniref:hypothetical protein n=1 Tax=Inquilinus sp. OTU3971 TaxID=3043855 RepID=UPI00313E8FC6